MKIKIYRKLAHAFSQEPIMKIKHLHQGQCFRASGYYGNAQYFKMHKILIKTSEIYTSKYKNLVSITVLKLCFERPTKKLKSVFF